MKLGILFLALAASAFGQARWEFGSGLGWASFAGLPVYSPSAVEPLPDAPQPVTPAPEVTARFIPVSLAAAAPQAGQGREAGVWHVELCNRTATVVRVPLPIMLEVAPEIRVIPGEFYTALLDQRTKRNPWHIVNDIVAGAGGITAVTGLAKGNSTVAAIGSGVTAALGILGSISKGQVSVAPAYTLPRPCQELAEVFPGACVECNVLASLMRRAETIGPRKVRVP